MIITLKEFFDIFISSIKKDQIFHKDLLSSEFKFIGIAMEFNKKASTGTLRICLATDKV